MGILKYFIQCGGKNQYFSGVRSTSENADIYTGRDEIYLVFSEKKNFSFYFILTEIQIFKAEPKFSLVVCRSI